MRYYIVLGQLFDRNQTPCPPVEAEHLANRAKNDVKRTVRTETARIGIANSSEAGKRPALPYVKIDRVGVERLDSQGGLRYAKRVTRTRLYDDNDDDDMNLRLSRMEGNMTAEEEGALWSASRSSVSSPCQLHLMSVRPTHTPLRCPASRAKSDLSAPFISKKIVRDVIRLGVRLLMISLDSRPLLMLIQLPGSNAVETMVAATRRSHRRGMCHSFRVTMHRVSPLHLARRRILHNLFVL